MNGGGGSQNDTSPNGQLDPSVIQAFAIENALDHDGKASIGSVMGSVVRYAKESGISVSPRDLADEVKRIVTELNKMPPDEMRDLLESIGGPIQLNKRERRVGLPELKGAESAPPIMRFAPGPSGPLHIGHTRAAVLNDEYCRKYHGRFILRFEDTNPEKIDPKAYDMIPEDLNWLGVKVHDTYIQSDRFEIYYDVCRQLLTEGNAYICTTEAEKWRKMKAEGIPCSERDASPEENLEGWERMLDGTTVPGEATLVVKTDIAHKNPAVRDFVGMRIVDTPHPRTGNKYRVYPMYNLSVAIDDHLMECSHILRGMDHLNNTIRQEYVYHHMGWELPTFIHYGLVSIEDINLKTSKIREQIMKGIYSGWDDVRLGTLKALDKRGIKPEALRNYWIDVGTKGVDITFSWENLYAMNRDIIDASTRRFFFVKDPVELRIRTSIPLKASIPYLPDEPEKGSRQYEFQPMNGQIDLLVQKEDIEDLSSGDVIRLKDLANVEIRDPLGGEADYKGQDVGMVRSGTGRIIQWLPKNAEECRLLYPDGSELKGLVETEVIKEAEGGRIVQFERIGFFRTVLEDIITCRFTHK